jgi:hypothetical protein
MVTTFPDAFITMALPHAFELSPAVVAAVPLQFMVTDCDGELAEAA